jgi:deoxycytidine triphosphate deaminase
MRPHVVKGEVRMPASKMGTLNHNEIVRQLDQGELIVGARKKDGGYDVEPASYDLTAGTVVWKEARRGIRGGDVKIRHFNRDDPECEDNTLSLQPGQMVFVITLEDVRMPTSLCGTVYSRNKLAREEILALNAGHIDPGFQGPIVIRLISLRDSPWALKLGDPIFTIVFHTVCCGPHDDLQAHPTFSREETLRTVRASAAEALSNALFDLYAADMREQLLEHYAGVEQHIRDAVAKDFVKRDDLRDLILTTVRNTWWGYVILVAAVANILGLVLALVVVLRSGQASPPSSVPTNVNVTVPASPAPGTYRPPSPGSSGAGNASGSGQRPSDNKRASGSG